MENKLIVRISMAAIIVLCVACSLISCTLIPWQRYPDNLDLSRESFIREMVNASKTRNTKYFTDYTPGSYHVAKLDLIEAVFSLSNSTTKYVSAVLIVGPAGPLWQYNIITIVDSIGGSKSVRVNNLIFAHARITRKSTRELARADYRRIMDKILSNPLLRDVSEKDQNEDAEWGLSVAVVDFRSGNKIRVVSDSVARQVGAAQKLLYNAFDKLSGWDEAKETYD